MIIAKRTAALLLLLGTLLALGACRGEPADHSGLFDDMTDPVLLDAVYVVLPSPCPPAVYEAARSLCDALSLRTDTLCEPVFDYTDLPAEDEHTLAVYVGPTKAVQTQAVLSDLRYRDYAVVCEPTHAVLAAHTEQETLLAISLFEKDFLPLLTSVSPDWQEERTVRAAYPARQITLCGIPLSHYAISYETEQQKQAAADLRLSLAEQTGFVLPLHAQSELKQGQYHIALCAEGAERGEAAVADESPRVSLRSAEAYGLSLAAERLLALLSPTVGKDTVAAVLPEPLSVSYSTEELTLSGRFFAATPTLTELHDVIISLQEDNAALIHLGGLTPDVLSLLSEQFSASYGTLALSNGSRLLFRKDIFASAVLADPSQEGVLTSAYLSDGQGNRLLFAELAGAPTKDTLSRLSDRHGTPLLVSMHIPSQLGEAVLSELSSLSRASQCADSITEGHTESVGDVLIGGRELSALGYRARGCTEGSLQYTYSTALRLHRVFA